MYWYHPFTRPLGLLLLLLLGSVLPAAASAQTTAFAVQVTLRDAAGQPVPFVTATAADLAGQALATAQTDDTGTATLGDLHVSTVRIVVVGQLRDGTPLMLPGADAAGILLLLDGPVTPLDLVVDADGSVAPDPATMLAPQPSGLGAPAPLDIRDAPRAPAVAMPPQAVGVVQPTAAPGATAQDAAGVPPLPVADAAPAADSVDATTRTLLLLFVGLLLLISSGVVLLRARRRPGRQA